MKKSQDKNFLVKNVSYESSTQTLPVSRPVCCVNSTDCGVVTSENSPWLEVQMCLCLWDNSSVSAHWSAMKLLQEQNWPLSLIFAQTTLLYVVSVGLIHHEKWHLLIQVFYFCGRQQGGVHLLIFCCCNKTNNRKPRNRGKSENWTLTIWKSLLSRRYESTTLVHI